VSPSPLTSASEKGRGGDGRASGRGGGCGGGEWRGSQSESSGKGDVEEGTIARWRGDLVWRSLRVEHGAGAGGDRRRETPAGALGRSGKTGQATLPAKKNQPRPEVHMRLPTMACSTPEASVDLVLR